MAALTSGPAPLFSLPTLDGDTFSLSPGTPTVLVFFKAECPTCQYAMPFIARLYARCLAGKSHLVRFAAIAENSASEAREFLRRFKISLPVLIEDGHKYPVSSAYGLAHVPTIFLISAAGEIEFSSVGWARADFEELDRRIVALTGTAPAPLFRAGEDIAAFKSG